MLFCCRAVPGVEFAPVCAICGKNRFQICHSDHKHRSYQIQTAKVLLIKAALHFSALLPLRWAHAIATPIASIVWALSSDSRRITRCNLALCFPQLTEREREKLARASALETTKFACELGRVWLRSVDEVLASIVSVSGQEVLEIAFARGKGVIVLAPHIGNWELCGLYLDRRAQTTYLYKPPKLVGFEDAIVSYRGRAGARLAPTSRKGIAMLVKALERGEIVGILPDQEPALDSGVFAPFFGLPALTMTLVAKLAARTQATVIVMYAERLPQGKGFAIRISEADVGVAAEDLETAGAALNRQVERCVREVPVQYQWEYRRFKHQPDNSKNALYR